MVVHGIQQLAVQQNVLPGGAKARPSRSPHTHWLEGKVRTQRHKRSKGTTSRALETVGFLTEVVAPALEQLVRNVALVAEHAQPPDFGLNQRCNFVVRQPRNPRLLVRLAVVVSVQIGKRHNVLNQRVGKFKAQNLASQIVVVIQVGHACSNVSF